MKAAYPDIQIGQKTVEAVLHRPRFQGAVRFAGEDIVICSVTALAAFQQAEIMSRQREPALGILRFGELDFKRRASTVVDADCCPFY